jgi:hypothetical protein
MAGVRLLVKYRGLPEQRYFCEAPISISAARHKVSNCGVGSVLIAPATENICNRRSKRWQRNSSKVVPQ